MSFSHALQDLADEDETNSLRVHIFSLSDFREAAGGKWTRLGGLIQVAVEAIARRHMNLDNDIFTQLDDEISCLALPNTDRSATRACVAAIAKDIAGHLFGDATINGRRPQVLVANLELAQALMREGGLDRDALAAAVAQAGAALKPPPGRKAEAPHRASLSAVAVSGFTGDGTQPEWFEVSAPVPAPVPAAESEAVADSPAMTGESKLTLLWSPTWVTAQQSVGAFHARVVRTDGDGTPSLEGCHAYRDASPVETLTLDRFVATGAAAELRKLHFSGRRYGLTVPFHWWSLAPKWRDCLTMPLRECPPQALRKFLKIEVFGLSSGTPPVLDRLVEPLAALGADVMVRIPLSRPEMIGGLKGVKAVGVDLAELADDERVGDDELFRRLQRFRAAARDHRLACYVWSGRRRPLIARLIGDGFSLLNGPGVMCDLTHPSLPTQTRQVA